MKLATSAQMHEIDARTINETGIPGIVLMENAALRVVMEIEKSLVSLKDRRITVFAGKGNNGGDAFAVARHLFNNGSKVKVYTFADITQLTGDSGINYKAMLNTGVECIQVKDDSRDEEIEAQIADVDIIVDGMLGTGIKGEVRGVARNLIELINKSGRPVVAIDVPSGLDSDTGRVSGTCIKAAKTVTFGLLKTGLTVYPGKEYCGEVILADIGIPSNITESININVHTIDEEFAASLIPRRKKDSNKGSYGRVLVIGCSTGMTGAGCMAAGAALRSGAGLVYLGVPRSLAAVCSTMFHEPIILPFEDEEKGYFLPGCLEALKARIEGCSAVALGPGMSLNEDTVNLVHNIIEYIDKPFVIDADGLNAVAKDISILKKLKAPVVITPHPGEMARLAGITIEQVQNNRIEIAREFACKWNTVTVLKGAATVVASPDGIIYINTTGNPGMATAGAGDVLTGLITGLMAQGAKALDAALAGVYLHGLAGDIQAKIIGEHGLTAGDILNEIPYAIKSIIKNSKNN